MRKVEVCDFSLEFFSCTLLIDLMVVKSCGKSSQTSTLVATKVANKSFTAGLQPIHVKRLLLPTHVDPNVQETCRVSQERVAIFTRA